MHKTDLEWKAQCVQYWAVGSEIQLFTLKNPILRIYKFSSKSTVFDGAVRKELLSYPVHC